MSVDIRDRIVEFTRIKASELKPHQQNWRKHPKAQQDAMAGILKEVGYVDALMVREHDGGYQIIDGHLRAETTPDAMVPVLVVDLDDIEAAKVLATFDPIAAMAERDSANLAELLKSLDGDDAVVRLVLPDYIVDPLLTADWTPASVDEMPQRGATDHSVVFSVEAWETVRNAITRYKEFHDNQDLTDAECIELICQAS